MEKPNLGVATQTEETGNLSVLLRSPQYSDRFKEILKDRSPQFISSILQVGRSLGSDCDAKSIITSAMNAAVVDLPIDKNLGFAWIVPYKIKGKKYAQFQIGWKGYVQLAQRSGQYKNISVPRAINKEAFQGYDSIGVPIIDWNLVDETTENPVGYAFGWRLVNGGESVFFWPIDKIKAHATRYSQSYRGGYDSPWKTHFPEMCKKTVVKNSIAQFGILSIQMQHAVQTDASVTMDVDTDPVFVDNPQLDDAKEDKPVLTAPTEQDDNIPMEFTQEKIKEEISSIKNPQPLNLVSIEVPVEQPKPAVDQTPHGMLNEFLSTNGISFSNFQKWLGNRHPDASSFGSISDVPVQFVEALLKNAKSLKNLVLLHGKQ